LKTRGHAAKTTTTPGTRKFHRHRRMHEYRNDIRTACDLEASYKSIGVPEYLSELGSG
jgi:hypothetical protein